MIGEHHFVTTIMIVCRPNSTPVVLMVKRELICTFEIFFIIVLIKLILTCITPVITNGIIVRGKLNIFTTDKTRNAFPALNGSV